MVIKNAFIYGFFLLLAGCFSEEKERKKTASAESVDETVLTGELPVGELSILIGAQNNPFLHYAATINAIYLITAEGDYVDFRDESALQGYSIDFSKLNEHKELLIRASVPVDNYYGIAVDFDMQGTTLIDSLDGETLAPDLYDDYGKALSTHDELLRIESNFDLWRPLIVQADEPAVMTLTLDVDASTQWIGETQAGIDRFVFSPLFSVESGIDESEPVSIRAVLNRNEGQDLVLRPVSSFLQNQLDTVVSVTNPMRISLNHQPVEASRLKEYADSKQGGLVLGQGHYRNGRFMPSSLAYYHPEEVPALLDGYIDLAGRYVGTVTDLTQINRFPVEIFVADGEVSEGSPLIAGTPVLATVNEELVADTGKMQRLPATFTGIIEEITDDTLSVAPLSVEALGIDMFYPSDQIIKVPLNQGLRHTPTLYSVVTLTGEFLAGGQFNASDVKEIAFNDRRVTLILPPVTDIRLFDSVDDKVIRVDTDKSDSYVQFITLGGSSVVENAEGSLSNILLSNNRRFEWIISTELVQESHKIYRFESPSAFSEALTEQETQGFYIHKVITDGALEGDELTAERVIVRMQKSPDKVSVSANSDGILRGRGGRRHVGLWRELGISPGDARRQAQIGRGAVKPTIAEFRARREAAFAESKALFAQRANQGVAFSPDDITGFARFGFTSFLTPRDEAGGDAPARKPVTPEEAQRLRAGKTAAQPRFVVGGRPLRLIAVGQSPAITGGRASVKRLGRPAIPPKPDKAKLARLLNNFNDLPDNQLPIPDRRNNTSNQSIPEKKSPIIDLGELDQSRFIVDDGRPKVSAPDTNPDLGRKPVRVYGRR